MIFVIRPDGTVAHHHVKEMTPDHAAAMLGKIDRRDIESVDLKGKTYTDVQMLVGYGTEHNGWASFMCNNEVHGAVILLTGKHRWK